MGSHVDASTRSRLLEAARSLLVERGFAGTTTRAIAERADVNSALVHYHFRTKTALLVEAAIVSLGDASDAPVRLLREADSVAAGVGAAVAWLGELDVADPMVRLVVELTIEAFHNPEVRPAVAEALEVFRVELAGALAARGDIDAALVTPLAALLAALFDGVMLHRLVDADLDVVPWVRAAEAAFGGEAHGASLGRPR